MDTVLISHIPLLKCHKSFQVSHKHPPIVLNTPFELDKVYIFNIFMMNAISMVLCIQHPHPSPSIKSCWLPTGLFNFVLAYFRYLKGDHVRMSF